MISAVLPFVYLYKEKLWYPRAVQVVAVAIALVGLYWGMQRIFF